jgi:hypothetical protein
MAVANLSRSPDRGAWFYGVLEALLNSSFSGILERFRAKWTPVRVKKTRQNKRLEPGSDSIRTDKALVNSRIAVGR